MRTAREGALVLLTVWGCTPVGVAPPTPPELPPEEVEAGPTPEPAAVPRSDPPVASRPTPRPVRTFDEVRGLWVVRFTMTAEAEVRRMVEDAAAAGFNTLVVQVRGRGDAFYRSAIEPRAEPMQGPDDFDPLALTIEEAHRRGMAVHAWVNTHLVWGPTDPPASPRHLVNEHPEWLAVPRVLADDLIRVDPGDPRFYAALRRYAADRPETVEGIYSSPSHPGVRGRVTAVWLDLLARYDLDGLHFDYIRFPSEEFDYSRSALERFRTWVGPRLPPGRLAALDALSGRSPLAFADALPAEWDAFRRSQITSLVAEIYAAVKARRPELVVSAAVVADPEAAFGRRFQDWQGWLRDGILDVAVPMAYTSDNGRFQALVRSARSAAGSRERVWAGVGAYLNTLRGTLDKIDVARSEGAGGIVLFSYDWAAGEGRGDPGDPFLERVGRERFLTR